LNGQSSEFEPDRKVKAMADAPMKFALQPVITDRSSLSDFTVKPGDKMTFTFAGDVAGYALGLWGFYISYDPATDDHGVRSVGLQFGAPQKTPITDSHGNVTTEITVDLDATITDGSYQVDPDASWVLPVCLAWIGDSSADVVVGTERALTATQTGIPAPSATGGAQLFSASWLAGFAMSYGNITGNMHQMNATTMLGSAGNLLSADVGMSDDEEHVATTATADAGWFATTLGASNLVIQSVPASQTEAPPVKMPAAVSQFAVMITDWTVVYQGGDHNVQGFGVGQLGSAQYDSATYMITVPTINATMKDNRWAKQDDNLSKVQALMLGITR
jgi:hypothetical protein